LVSVRYTLLDEENGQPLPENVAVFDDGYVQMVIGAGGFFPGLHRCVPLLDEVGKPETFTVPAVDAFGEANPNIGPVLVPKEQAPEGLKVGERVQLSNGMKARVTMVDDTGVTIDANHPFAGRSLALTAELTAEPKPAAEVLQTATFACGCFWGIELAFQRCKGVVVTEVGYAQGAVDNPTYEQVCSGSTGHTEAVKVMFNPSDVSYESLCDLFWDRLGESRYKLNQVGNDRGTQYRHGIYTHSDDQLKVARATLKEAEAAASGQTVHTEVEPVAIYWSAEDYHQQYLQKGGQSARKTAEETIRCYG